MLLSPTLAFAKPGKEIWIDQVQEIYPLTSRRTQRITYKRRPRQQRIQHLRAMQSQSLFGYVRKHCFNCLAALSLPARVLARC